MKQLFLTFIITTINLLSVTAQEKSENFQKVDKDFLLNKIAKTTPGTWSMKKDSKERHYGLTDAEFFDNFGNDRVGKIGTKTEVSANDKAGFNYTAIHALISENIKLTNIITELESELNMTKNDVIRLNESNIMLQTMSDKLEKLTEMEQIIKDLEYRITNIEQKQEE